MLEWNDAPAGLLDSGLAVVVGGKASNFPQALREHPRVVWWDSTDPRTQSRELPTNARVVLVMRFVSHAVFSRVAAEARARNLLCVPGLQTPKHVQQFLSAHLPPEARLHRGLEPHENPARTQSPKQRAGRGEW